MSRLVVGPLLLSLVVASPAASLAQLEVYQKNALPGRRD